MITLFDDETGDEIGTISEQQLQSLVDNLEEECEEDQDYYINQDTLEMLKDSGLDDEVCDILATALGDRDGMDIRWKRT